MATKDITDLQVVEAYEYCHTLKDKKEYVFPYTRLSELTGQCEKVCYSACDRAATRGYIDYGVSLRTGWITDKGKKLLNENALRD